MDYTGCNRGSANLQILACIEVESHWRGILKANGVVIERQTTNDYVKLRYAMRLNEYAVRFPSYPWIEAIQPFAGWGSSRKLSQDLAWYAVYNAIKHDLENEFPRATLVNAFAAVAGCAVMMVAQFGRAYGLGRPQEIWTYFDISEVSKWRPSDVYMHSYGDAPGWLAVAYPF